nr:alpha-N-acetylglucosaminidase [Bacteroidales bacterium]
CTFGYTMAWWKWEQWERFIDWMALNGVNMPLAITGQEAVWQKVWKKYGLTDEQIRAYFVGPAHLPWQRMCNLDRWQGPLPQGWIDGQAKLQKRILKRERALNMTPILPAFAGHVPAELAEAVTEPIDTFRVSYWGGFANQYRCTFLSPMDPIYAKIQKDFLEEQTKMYGTNHIYGVDPFNEVDAPFWDPETLAKISKGIFESMTAVDPEAVWLQMGWLFWADQQHWTDENIEAYLTAVPQGRMIILDYYCDATQIWKRTNSFYGQPFIWCYLGNFGGMTGIEGDFHQNAEWLAETKANAGPGFVGIGSTLEGFGVNEPVYEHLLQQAWSGALPVDEYVDNIADRHLGYKDEAFRQYWHTYVDKVSKTHSQTSSSSLICAHPNLDGVWHWTTLFNRGYDINELEEVLKTLETVKGSSDYFKYDLANARRQVLDNRAPALRDRFTKAYREGNRAEMVKAADEFLALCDELTDVLKTRKEFSLCDWISDARSWGSNPPEKDYYEMNARTLISVWGDSFHLCDYANRDWDGLVETYYKPRWRMFFDAVLSAYDAGEPFVNPKSTGYVGTSAQGSAEGVEGRALQFDRDIWDFECHWAHIR